MSLVELLKQAKTLAELLNDYQNWKSLFRAGTMGNQQAYNLARDTRIKFEEGKWVSVEALKQWQAKVWKLYNDFPSRCEFVSDDDYSLARYEWEKKMEETLGLEEKK
jgi:hypothetical protein